MKRYILPLLLSLAGAAQAATTTYPGITSATGGGVTDGGVTTAKLASDSVTSVKIANSAVTTSKLATDAVAAAAVLNGAITTPKLHPDLQAQIANAGGAISNGAITTDKLSADAVTSAKILNAQITTPKLATDAVTTAAILTGAVTTVKLGSGAVTTTKIMPDAVVGASIINAAITTPKMATDAVSASAILNGSITTPKLHPDVQAQLGGGSTFASGLSITGTNGTNYLTAASTMTVSGDGSISAPSQPGARVGGLSNTSYPSGVYSTIYWSGDLSDGGYNRGMWGGTTSSSTFKTPSAGVYYAVMCLQFPALTSTTRMGIYYGGGGNTPVQANVPISSTFQTQSCVTSGFLSLSAGVSVYGVLFQSEGSNITMPNGGPYYQDYFSIQKIW